MSLDDALSPEGTYCAMEFCCVILMGLDNEAPRHRHRPTHSQEGRPRPEGLNSHPRPEGPNGHPGPRPERRPHRAPPRPRRNSDTSVNERRSEDIDGSRHGPRPHGSHRPRPTKDSQGRPIPHKESRSKRANKRLDTIDKLDLTGIYGEGSECLLKPHIKQC
jgi:hypothetical protein